MSDQASGKAEHGVAEEAAKPAQQCHAGSDGDCFWPECPQEANNRANYQVECPLRSHDEGENDDGESLVKHEVTSSAHFPRITKHDLEVVVEAMDKLREALRADDRELVEKLERLTVKWSDWNSTAMTPITCADELRAVLAARNEGGTK